MLPLISCLSCLFLCACTLGHQVRPILLLYMTGDVLRSYSFVLEAVSKECLQETSLFDIKNHEQLLF